MYVHIFSNLFSSEKTDTSYETCLFYNEGLDKERWLEIGFREIIMYICAACASFEICQDVDMNLSRTEQQNLKTEQWHIPATDVRITELTSELTVVAI
jgi:hypothetical protein